MSLATFAAGSPQDPENSQVVTRLALTLSIVERGELAIDRFAPYTIDKAKFEGHYHADEAPDHWLHAIPAVLLAARPAPQ